MPVTLYNFLRPFEDFFKSQVAGGIVLLGATVLALGLANSPLAHHYQRLWELELTIGFPGLGLTKSLHHWINDGLMAVFFFVVGLEIKREFLAGELASLRQATLPIAAAFGGMLIPALVFRLLVDDAAQTRGWGIPMATDIAFALGVIALLGERIPRSLAIFLTALAIVDDLGAVLVIAVFYTGDLSWTALGIGLGSLLLLVAGNRLGLKTPNFFALVGLILWLALLKSGVHASIAGVLIGATIPVRARYPHEEFLRKVDILLERYRSHETIPGPFHHESRIGTLFAIEHVCHDTMSPLQRMEHEMQHWVIFGVMPIFALANAGLPLSISELQAALAQPVTWGVAGGLLLGKPIGILFFSWLAVKAGWADLPGGTKWLDILGVGILAGIGFTMSLFITNLAFHDPFLAGASKVGIFSASLLAGALGYLVLARRRPPAPA
jgi:NhaA family Na+:H+ antiporter